MSVTECDGIVTPSGGTRLLVEEPQLQHPRGVEALDPQRRSGRGCGSAVEDGRLTQAQSNKLQADMEERITDMVNGTPPAGGFRHRFGPPPEDGQDESNEAAGAVA